VLLFEHNSEISTSSVLKFMSINNSRHRDSQLLISLSLLYWIFQVAWFWRYCKHNINVDAISYIGIARHVADGDFRSSLHGYWSPLISWMIAAASLAGGDHTLTARLVMLPTFALCLVLLYWLTQRLWNSRLLSSLAVLWFVAARGIAAFSVYFIGADLLFTAVVLVYFILLLGCLEQPERMSNWGALGIAHGVVFLAKAIAMPLLALATLMAVLFGLRRNPKKAASALVVAAIFPALVWAGWGTALQTKYGKFTTGYQLRWNLLDPAMRSAPDRSLGLTSLDETRASYDAYMVTDAMPPGSRFWQAKVWRPALLGQIARKEAQNIPVACKEFLVLLTPGGVLALVVCVVQLTRGQRISPVRARFVWIVLLTTTALVVAYCMLVFDGRYVIPMTPVLVALSIRFALPPGRAKESTRAPVEEVTDAGRWQTAIGVILVVGLIGTQVYRASPFRTLTQDFQRSVYEAADVLKKDHASNIVVIGCGPYPEHGVGWEAGIYSAYFADARIVGELFDVPRDVNTESVVTDVARVAPDAVLVWGTPSDSKYSAIVRTLQEAHQEVQVHSIHDPIKGEVGSILLLKCASSAETPASRDFC
jgi:4-amino-4-deoxy-L-arabinose transferase-like glycosyltransferase